MSLSDEGGARRLLNLVRDDANSTVYVESHRHVYVRNQAGQGAAEELELVDGFTFASNSEVEAIAEHVLLPLIITGVGHYDMVVEAHGWEANIAVPVEGSEPIRARMRFDRGVPYIDGTYATIHIQKYGVADE